MAYATQDQLKYLSEHMTECRKHGYNRYRMLIVSDSEASGRKNAQIMQSIYPEGELKDNSGGYRDFSIEFTYMWQRDQAVQDINSLVGGYRQQHFQYTPDEARDPEDTGTNVVGSGDDTGSTDSTGQNSNAVIYVIIGIAVVAAALLILIPKKK